MGTPTAAGATAECDDQTEAIAFLSDPASYPSKPDRVERFETHGALVFLAGAEAWKIKRAVRFAYMDFSTLAKRKAVCEREIEVNRPNAPEIYLACLPITRARDGRLAFGGSGEVVEWAVHMRRFEQSALLSEIAAAGPLSPELTRDLADTVYESHELARPVAGLDAMGRMDALVGAVSATLAALHDAFDGTTVEQFRHHAARQMDRAGTVIEARAAAGLVRRCHGDLHLGNVVLWKGRPALFDAIEFDEDLATIDTLYDLAFLLMDLDVGGQRLAANGVLNRYLWRSPEPLDLDGLCTLPLFLGLRAGVRAMVTAQRAEQSRGARRAEGRRRARRYLDAAIAYLGAGAPYLIAVGGLSGTGKSTLARALAPDVGPAPGAVHLRSDLERKKLHGVEETVRLGPDAYTQAANDTVYAILCDKARRVLAAGHAAIVDAVYGTPEERIGIEAVAADLGIPFRGLWLEAPRQALIDRVAARTGDASDATPDVVEQQLTWNTGAFGSSWARLDSGGSRAETLEGAREHMARPF